MSDENDENQKPDYTFEEHIKAHIEAAQQEIADKKILGFAYVIAVEDAEKDCGFCIYVQSDARSQSAMQLVISGLSTNLHRCNSKIIRMTNKTARDEQIKNILSVLSEKIGGEALSNALNETNCGDPECPIHGVQKPPSEVGH